MKRWLVVWIMLSPYLCSYVVASMINATRDSLNSFVYEYGVKNLPRRHHSGKLYNVDLPVNFSGMEVSVIRLRTSRLWRNGLNLSSFEIPPEMLPVPFTRRLDVVYQSLGNWSKAYYSLPDYSFVSPVVGFLAYDSYTSSANHGVVELKARGDSPIIVRFSNVGLDQDEDRRLKCVRFMTNGSWELSNLTSKSTCFATGQGHFSVVVPFKAGKGRKLLWKWWIIAIAAGVVVLILIVVFATLVVACLKRQKVWQMERESERSEVLDTIWIRNSKMPFASVIRTEPAIENNYLSGYGS